MKNFQSPWPDLEYTNKINIVERPKLFGCDLKEFVCRPKKLATFKWCQIVRLPKKNTPIIKLPPIGKRGDVIHNAKTCLGLIRSKFCMSAICEFNTVSTRQSLRRFLFTTNYSNKNRVPFAPIEVFPKFKTSICTKCHLHLDSMKLFRNHACKLHFCIKCLTYFKESHSKCPTDPISTGLLINKDKSLKFMIQFDPVCLKRLDTFNSLYDRSYISLLINKLFSLDHCLFGIRRAGDCTKIINAISDLNFFSLVFDKVPSPHNLVGYILKIVSFCIYENGDPLQFPYNICTTSKHILVPEKLNLLKNIILSRILKKKLLIPICIQNISSSCEIVELQTFMLDNFTDTDGKLYDSLLHVKFFFPWTHKKAFEYNVQKAQFGSGFPIFVVTTELQNPCQTPPYGHHYPKFMNLSTFLVTFTNLPVPMKQWISSNQSTVHSQVSRRYFIQWEFFFQSYDIFKIYEYPYLCPQQLRLRKFYNTELYSLSAAILKVISLDYQKFELFHSIPHEYMLSLLIALLFYYDKLGDIKSIVSNPSSQMSLLRKIEFYFNILIPNKTYNEKFWSIFPFSTTMHNFQKKFYHSKMYSNFAQFYNIIFHKYCTKRTISKLVSRLDATSLNNTPLPSRVELPDTIKSMIMYSIALYPQFKNEILYLVSRCNSILSGLIEDNDYLLANSIDANFL